MDASKLVGRRIVAIEQEADDVGWPCCDGIAKFTFEDGGVLYLESDSGGSLECGTFTFREDVPRHCGVDEGPQCSGSHVRKECWACGSPETVEVKS